eukprot:TRINITY_DN8509_c0_g1_i1.p1 TRINITY_DN8509_c0_g1~~TRINITY_DN8509_c0_g1_i1.p1  ORF type:complete len:191 (-),score=34.70 TRINITY_DN8509_c0_g1_i1:53-625(-)
MWDLRMSMGKGIRPRCIPREAKKEHGRGDDGEGHGRGDDYGATEDGIELGDGEDDEDRDASALEQSLECETRFQRLPDLDLPLVDVRASYTSSASVLARPDSSSMPSYRLADVNVTSEAFIRGGMQEVHSTRASTANANANANPAARQSRPSSRASVDLYNFDAEYNRESDETVLPQLTGARPLRPRRLM